MAFYKQIGIKRQLDFSGVRHVVKVCMDRSISLCKIDPIELIAPDWEGVVGGFGTKGDSGTISGCRAVYVLSKKI